MSKVVWVQGGKKIFKVKREEENKRESNKKPRDKRKNRH